MITMIDEKNKKQRISCNRPQQATINISGIPGEEDEDLLAMMYQVIETERELGLSMQKGYFAVKEPKTSK